MSEKQHRPKKILFIFPFSLGRSPAQRFRAEAYFDILKENDFLVDYRAFFGHGSWNILYGSGNAWQKGWLVLKGFLKRLYHVLFIVPKYDYVFIQREASPLGPPVFEWMMAKLLRKKIIFDFDDATWVPNNSVDSKFISWLKAFWKVKYLCKWAHKVSAGNNYLAAYARQFAKDVVVIPTVIDTEETYFVRQPKKGGKTVVGWTGSHSTIRYLRPLVPVLQQLQPQHDFTVLVIADKKPDFDLKDWQFLPWNAKTEISDLQKIDIGLMPLTHDPWSEGKCGFKLIQYMGIGIPAVASPVGVNKEIIEHGVNGYLAEGDEEWKAFLSKLLTDEKFREEAGRKGRKKIVAQYCLQSQQQAFLKLFS